MSGIFHKGEVSVQSQIGFADVMAPIGVRAIRDFMPDQHRDFFEKLPMIHVGALDDEGQPWATIVVGEPGFMQSPDPKNLIISGTPLMADALNLDLKADARLGLLGLDMTNRRRNRMNGHLVAGAGQARSLHIAVDQSFGNCPQYIQVRTFERSELSKASAKILAHSTGFDDEASRIAERVDTFFIASRTKEIAGAANQGLDVSHRGGKPGFVKVADDGSLFFPDFSGNRFFNTLGNIVDDGRVGLFLPDFAANTAVYITGRAEILWDETLAARYLGAERFIRVTPTKVVRVALENLPYGKVMEVWPLLRRTGTWEDPQPHT